MVQYSLPHVSSQSRHLVVRPTARSMHTPPHSFISSSHIPYGSFFFIIIAQSIDTASYVFKGLISLCTFASLDIELDSPLYLVFLPHSIPCKPPLKAIDSDPDSTTRPGSETPGANKQTNLHPNRLYHLPPASLRPPRFCRRVFEISARKNEYILRVFTYYYKP
jgi:hypothetical protein